MSYIQTVRYIYRQYVICKHYVIYADSTSYIQTICHTLTV